MYPYPYLRRLAVPGIATAAAVLLTAGPAMALPGFGTAPVSGGGSVSTPWSPTGEGVSAVTVGHHAGYDRVVFAFRDHTLRFEASYVSGVTQDASGAPVPLRGSAFLALVLRGATTGLSVQRTITPGFPMLKQVKGAGDFEGVVSYGIGAASRSGFRAFTLTGPNRLVIDLAIPAAAASGSAGSSGTATGSAATGTETADSSATGSQSTGSQSTGSQSTGSEATASGSTGSGTASAQQVGPGDSSGGVPATGLARTLPLVLGGLALVGLGGAGLWLARRRYATRTTSRPAPMAR